MKTKKDVYKVYEMHDGEWSMVYSGKSRVWARETYMQAKGMFPVKATLNGEEIRF